MPQILDRRGWLPKLPQIADQSLAVGLAAWSGIAATTVSGQIVTRRFANSRVEPGSWRGPSRPRLAYPVGEFGSTVVALNLSAIRQFVRCFAGTGCQVPTPPRAADARR